MCCSLQTVEVFTYYLDTERDEQGIIQKLHLMTQPGLDCSASESVSAGH